MQILYFIFTESKRTEILYDLIFNFITLISFLNYLFELNQFTLIIQKPKLSLKGGERMEEVSEKILLSALSEDYECIVEIIGIERIRKLMKNVGGTTIHIPNEQILKRYIENKCRCEDEMIKDKRVYVNNIPEQYQEVANIIGMELYMKLVENFGGSNLYIPNEKSIKKIIRRKKIIEEFDGSNHSELAKKYKISERWIYEITRHRNVWSD